jgi:predicted neutral ceramidase superfamily lipid hydrolase
MTFHTKPTPDINPVWEEEIKKILEELWENRHKLSVGKLRTIRNFIK